MAGRRKLERAFILHRIHGQVEQGVNDNGKGRGGRVSIDLRKGGGNWHL